MSNSTSGDHLSHKPLDPNSYQGTNEFHNEVKLVSSFNHPNIIPFVGYCDDANEKIIEALPNMGTTPEDILKGSNRSKVVHSGVGEHSRVIRRDLKSANILLDANLEANICDFGLSRLSPRNHQDTLVCTTPRSSGTRFYIDPSYMEIGMLSKESEIYSFGVIDIVRSYYDDCGLFDGFDKLKDHTIEDETGMRPFHKFNEIAHECINLDVRKRPTMDKIIKAITGALNFQISRRAHEELNILEAEDEQDKKGPSYYYSGKCQASPKESTRWQKDFWEELLSPDYQEIIVRAVPPLDIGSKKPLYFRLSDSRIFLDGGYLSFGRFVY
ncbi:hypothetical protein Lser_V15G06115 [Lactuca serriola]